MNYKQTKLFSEFQCVGDSCINNCCHDWLVTWSKEGVEKLQTASGCSDKLKALVQSAFEPSNDGKYTIKLEEGGKCPFQVDGGLCIIQKELGEEFLSDVCTVFPRRYFSAGQTVYCNCVLSCPAVLQKLIEVENAAVLLTAKNKPDIRCPISSAADASDCLRERPEYKYHKELLEFFYEIISDKRFSAEVNIVRGALAAEKLTETVKTGGGKKIAGMIDDLRTALDEENVIRVIESVQPELEAKLRMLTVYTESLFGTGLADLFKNMSGQADSSRFAYAEERLGTVLEGKAFWFRNIALNLLLELAVPFRYSNKSIYGNYAEFAVVAAVLKMSVMAAVMRDRLSIETNDGTAFEFHGMDCVTGLCSVIIRQINQNKTAVDELLERFNSGMVTPRDIAMLIK